jgi:hypothetical protein
MIVNLASFYEMIDVRTREDKKLVSLKKEIEVLRKRNAELFELREMKLDGIRNKLGASYPTWAAKHPELSSTSSIILSSLKVTAHNGHKNSV